MAILKANLEESLLTQQEQAALRVCFHVSQLSEGLAMLDKVFGNPQMQDKSPLIGYLPSATNSENLAKLRKFLMCRIETVITSYTAPSLPKLETKETNKSP